MSECLFGAREALAGVCSSPAHGFVHSINSCCFRARFNKATGVIIGVHVIGEDACELIHFGMRLVKERATLSSVIAQMFVAVTFHELFKAAALDGNNKLAFGQYGTALRGIVRTFIPVPHF